MFLEPALVSNTRLTIHGCYIEMCKQRLTFTTFIISLCISNISAAIQFLNP